MKRRPKDTGDQLEQGSDDLARLAEALIDVDARILGPQVLDRIAGRPQDLGDIRLLESLDDRP
jgi:hypothetical protein